MKKILSSFFIFLIAFAGVAFTNVLSTKSVSKANAESAYDISVSNAFSDNENLSALVAENLSLESRFNVLESGKVNLELYDQNPYGTCYATSLAQVLNLSYEYRTGEHIKVSALALALQIEDLFFKYGSNDMAIIESSYNLCYLSEFDFPYELANEYDREIYLDTDIVNIDYADKEIIDVEEYYSFPYYVDIYNSSKDYQDLYFETIKKAVVKQGALGVGLRYKVDKVGDYFVYNRNNSEVGGHAMTLIGYDDSFDKNNFVTPASRDGAFIILNSWGTNREEIVYLSYEDLFALEYVYGIADFVQVDERAESVSNINTAYYGIIDKFTTDSSANGLEFGYVIENTTNNGFLSQIDLQPTLPTNPYYYTDYYSNSLDVEIYINATSSNLDNASTFVGAYDIASGTNKIVLDSPISVGEEFALKFVVKDNSYTFGYFDRKSQKFNAFFAGDNGWETVSYSNDNYNLVGTPFYLNISVSDGETYEISKEDNYQTATTNAVTFNISSNETINDIGVQVFKHSEAIMTFSTFEMIDAEVSNLFNVDVNAVTGSVSISQKTFMSGTFKVVISVNSGEKKFVKFLCYDDGIKLTTLILDPVGDFMGYNQSLYDNALMADTISVTIPGSCYMSYTVDNGTKFSIKNAFLYDVNNVKVSSSYTVDPQSRITAATIVFTHNTLGTSKTVNLRFTYLDKNQILYTTAIPNASHSNPEFVDEGMPISLKPASAPNYDFLGWYSDPQFANRVTGIKFNESGVVSELYAKFVQKTAPTIAKEVAYDEDTCIMTVTLDFSSYNLSVYDTIEFKNIIHYMGSTSVGSSFTILKSALVNKTYSYQFYIEKANMQKVNTIEFDVIVKRQKIYDMAVSVSGSFPILILNSTLDMSVDVKDNISVTISSSGKGGVYNAVSGEKLASGIYYVNYGGDLYLNFTPDDKYYISSVIVNGLSVGIPSSYNFIDLKQNSTILVVFTLRTFEISMFVTGEGSVDKAPLETVSIGDSVTYTFTPDVGSYVDYVEIDGNRLSGITSYTFTNVQENHQIVIKFEKYRYTMTAVVTGKGNIGQPLVVEVTYGETLTYNFVASEGYTLSKIIIDDTEIQLTDSYTFESIDDNHTLNIIFVKDVVNVKISIIGECSVRVFDANNDAILENTSEDKSFVVEQGTNLKVRLITKEAYEISMIYINGVAFGTSIDFRYNNAIEDVEIRIVLTIKTYTLKLSVYGNGYSNQSSLITKNHNESISYEFFANDGYRLASIVVNGRNVNADSVYEIDAIKTNYDMVVTFEKIAYNITWIGYNNAVIATTKVEYNQIPVATFVTPTKPSEGVYVYAFAGWNTKLDGTGNAPVVATKDMAYYAQFIKKLMSYEIKVSVSGKGSIAPEGTQSVEYGKSKTFDFLAESGYHLSRIIIDDTNIIENISSYTFENVKKSHKILAIFKRNDFAVAVVNDIDKGEIVGKTSLEKFEYSKYTVMAKEGYEVSRVLVNGSEVKLDDTNSFVIESANSDVNIVVEYSSKSSSKAIKYLKENALVAVLAVVALGVGAGVLTFIKVRKKRKDDDEFNRDVI